MWEVRRDVDEQEVVRGRPTCDSDFEGLASLMYS